MKYAAIYTDENWVVTDYYDTEQEAIDQLEADCESSWEALKDTSYFIQGFSDEEIKKIEAQPEI